MKKENSKLDELFKLTDFVQQSAKAGGLPESIANEIKELWNEFKQDTIDNTCSVITAEFGFLGSIIIRKILENNKPNIILKYKEETYDYIDVITSSVKRILWTDFDETEPYNRNGGLYCDGASFEMLGKPVAINKFYREFNSTIIREDNICFAVWGFMYNDFYQSVTFGMSIKDKDTVRFIRRLCNIIGK